MREIDLELDVEDIKAKLFNKVDILNDMPIILQTLEKGKFIDELKDLIQENCDTEFSYLVKGKVHSLNHEEIQTN